ncbi:MAG: T9SS type A sorting domain-containing protein [Bacteroidales bacterium]|nr:T9SS type A sorting domain-containing protein [Bacteroidales bacterium]
MKKFTLLKSFAIAAGVMLAMNGWGQILTFEFSALAGGEATATSNSNDANLNSSTISRGAGLTAAANGGRFNATNWALTSIANAVSGNDYMEFTMTPNSGYQFSVSSIYVQWQRSATGNTAISLRSSVDSYATDLDAVKSVVDNTNTQNFTWTFTQENSSSPVTYRLYSYAEALTGSGGPGDGTGNDIVVYGTTSPIGGTPLITVAPTTLSNFTYVFGSGPSAEQTFTVEGSDLTANITITPPTNYEISETSLSGFTSNPITLTHSDGVVAETTIYVRLKAGLAVGNYDNELITLASTDADNKTVTCSGSVTAPPSITFYFRGPSWMDNNPHNPQIWGPYNGWATPPAMTFDVVPGWWSVTVEVADATAAIEYQSRFAQAGSTKYQKAFEDFGANATFTTTTDEIWIDASENDSFTWSGNDFYLAVGKITESEPVPPAPQIDWANLQWPVSGEITAGGSFNVYAQVNEPGVTDAAGQGAGITAWIGYSSNNTDPSTWTNWVSAAYSGDAGSNDEYVADIAPGLTPGTYYYASRFQLGAADYVYGGYNAGGGDFWDGATNVSGVLTVNAPPPPNVWINEIHYDNAGTDVDEFIEVVLENPGAYTLTDFAIYLVNGNGGAIYNTKTLDQFAVGTSYGNFTVYTFTYPLDGLQNGAPDGMAIAYQSALVPGQFLSYEGTFTGTGGAVNGILSVDIGVSEGSSTPIGYSLQLAGAGTQYSDFFWMQEAQNTSGTINNLQSFSAATTWNGSIDNDWEDAANWSNGLPVTGSNVTIPAVTNLPVLSSSATIGDLSIENGAGLTIQTTGSLTVSGTLTNAAGATGLVIKSDDISTGSLIQSTAGVNATMERFMNNADWTNWKDGWHFLGSPVANQAISPAFTTVTVTAYDFYLWNEPTNEWVNFKNQSGGGGTAPFFDIVNGSNNFELGRGYMAAYDAGGVKSFTGALNVADLPITGLGISAGNNNSWHLLGNPFSSALTWDASAAWGLTNIAGVAKIWNEANQSYTDLTSSPSTVIPATNGFMVQVSEGTGSLTIPAAKRVHSIQAFYKSTVSGMMLTARSHTAGNAQEARIVINPDATNGFDQMYDSEFLAGHAPAFYSSAGEIKLSTNSLPELSVETEIPFNFIKNEGNQFSIEASGIESISATPYLVDLKTGTNQNLAENPVYNFTSQDGDAPGRFLLKFSAVGIPEVPGSESLHAYVYDNILYVMNSGASKVRVEVYNIHGQLLMGEETAQGLQSLPVSVPPGTYLVKMTSEGATAIRKISIQ